MKEIMFVVGSAREGSFNRQLADYAEKALSGRALVRYLDYTDVPMFNQDIEFPAPEAVERVRGELSSVDGIWIFSPEYNGNIPPLLLNLIDWMSRPMTKGAPYPYPTPIKNLPTALSSAGGARAGANVLERLRDICGFLSMDLASVPSVGVPIGAAFVSGDLALSDDDVARVQAQADALLAEMEG